MSKMTKSSMNTYYLYIGSNNLTGKVDREDILTFLNKNVEGYTISDSIGVWKGKSEDSVQVTIANSDLKESEMKKLVTRLASKLSQDAIGFVSRKERMQFLSA